MHDNDPKTQEQRRHLIQALAFTGSGGLGLIRAALAQDVSSSRPHRLPAEQSVYRVTGRVRVNGQEAGMGTRINATDQIETEAGAEIIYAVGESAILVRENTRLIMSASNEDPKRVAAIDLHQGRMLAVFAPGHDKRFTTPASRVSSKTTGVYFEVDPDQTYFCNCYGVTEIEAAGDPGSRDTITATHHDRPVYILTQGESGKRVRAAPFIHHTDQELMLIESIVGRTVPFTFPASQYNAARRPDRY